MKKTILAAALLSLLGTGVVIGATDTEAVKQRVEQIKGEFNLDDQQAQRIQNILNRSGMNQEEQKAARMEKHMERRMSMMKEKLGLSDEQVTQMKTLMTQQREQMKALRDQGKADMEALLTPEQKTKMTEMQSQRKGHGRHGGHRGGHGKRMMHGGDYGKGRMCQH
ncbi:MAG: hypothetical protein R3E89_01490 [Thiolinea sp.]